MTDTNVSREFNSNQQLIDSKSLLSLISVGDLIRLEAELVEDETLLLYGDRYYEVVAKSEPSSQNPILYVQSDITGEVVAVYPGFVSDYQKSDEPAHHA